MFGLSFLAPLFLAGVLATAVPLVLHLLRREEAPEVALATTRFIQRAPVPRAKRRRLRDLVLLALRLLVLVLVAMAFARPFLAADLGAGRPSLTVIAIDTSFSMGGTARQQEAHRLARRALDDVPSGVPVAVMAFDDEARVVAQASDDRAVTTAAIAEARAGFGGTNYQALMAAASALFGSRTGSLVVVTDIQRVGWRAGRGSLPEGIELQLAALPPVTRNLSVRRARREGERVVAAVENHGTEDATTRVSIATEGDAFDTRTVSVARGRTLDVSFERGVPASGTVRVAIDDPQGLPADDVRFVLVEPPPPVPVVVVAQGGPRDSVGFFVSRALTVGDPARPIRVETVGGAEGANGPAPILTPSHVLMLLAARGVDRRTRSAMVDHVTGGGSAFLALGPGLDPAVAAELLGSESGVRVLDGRPSVGARHMSPLEARHPLFRVFGDAGDSLSRVSFTRAFEVEPGKATVLARFDDGRPALIESKRGRGRLLLLASDLDGAWNDFPRRAAFVPFVREVVRYLAAADRSTSREVLIGDMPDGVERRPGPFRLPGVEAIQVANVLTDESSGLAATPDEFQNEVEHILRTTESPDGQAAQEQEGQQSLWRYGLWAALAILVVESVVGRVWG